MKSLVKPKIISIDKKSSAKEAAELMVKNDIGSVVVTDSAKFEGIVTERDLLRKVTVAGKDPAAVRVGDIMSSPLVTIETTRGLGEATSLMVERKIRRLIAVENGKIVGIFTQRDLQQKIIEVFRALAESQALS